MRMLVLDVSEGVEFEWGFPQTKQTKQLNKVNKFFFFFCYFYSVQENNLNLENFEIINRKITHKPLP